MKTISVIDSHTGGEPTRVVIAGGPDLGKGTIAERAKVFESEFDHVRTAVIGEPRGSEVMVGALLCQPSDSGNDAGVIFFDNAGLLNMCGHGTIGFAVTLHYLGQIGLGSHTLETRVGEVGIELREPNLVRIKNVESFRAEKDVQLNLAEFGQVTGDIAWGGNWFFITDQSPVTLQMSNTLSLLKYTNAIRDQLRQMHFDDVAGRYIDHIELHEPADDEDVDAKSFVLCPGGAYDRSPCGTGTSAKVACLAADGKLKPGEIYRQQSIVGSVFEATYQFNGDKVVPYITGSAHISGEAKLILDPADPFCHGIIP